MQWQANSDVFDALDNALVSALTTHADFMGSAYAKNMMPFIVSEACNSGGYGNHIDDALMQGQGIVRTDLSCTLFLTDPAEYEGGELVMNLNGVEMAFKLNAGDAIMYPSTTLHRVNPVTKGTRRVALTWIESHIRSAEQREILFDLDTSRKQIMAENGKNQAFDKITKTHANLLRRWADT